MELLNFREINALIRLVSALDEELEALSADAGRQENELQKAAEAVRMKDVRASLRQIPVGELRSSRAGIRVKALEEAGFLNLEDLLDAPDSALTAVSGIGEKQAAAIRGIVNSFCRQIAERRSVRLLPGDSSPEMRSLILALACLRRGRLIRQDADPVREDFHGRLETILAGITVRNRFRWFFSGKKTKNRELQAVRELTELVSSPLFDRADSLCRQYRELEKLTGDEAEKDFEENAAVCYILLEKYCSGSPAAQTFTGSGISADLAAEINDAKLNLSCFSGELRAYQAFGTKFILHQKRVLLGDDMGLGKTVQASAAMAELYAEDREAHFLVVCPAGVLINWCRELKKFTSIPVYLLHGDNLGEELAAWQAGSGAAVTNYERMGRIVGEIDRKMRQSMLVIDEAHYIKNPQAHRTRFVRMLDEEAKHILLMTGTPLENHVNEMCALIDFIRPDLSDEVRSLAAMSRTQEFRELIAPVYLRRLRTEVLSELPPVEMKEEWCGLTDADREAYYRKIMEGNFTGARRVSFLQEDLNTSSKALRLRELCMEAANAGRRIILYSYFRETIEKVSVLLGDRCVWTITGSTEAAARQEILDRFAGSPGGSALICQIQAGGTGLNIQSASMIIFCEPQIKPSLMHQAVARAWRMGQVHKVQVYLLLCEGTVDEAVMQLLEEKQLQFDSYAEESAMAGAADALFDSEWIRAFMEKEHRRCLPVPVPEQGNDDPDLPTVKEPEKPASL